MSRIVLVIPPAWLTQPFTHYPLFDGLGALSNAAYLRAHEYDVRVVDAFSLGRPLNVRRRDEHLWHLGAEIQEVAERARAAAGERPEQTVVAVALTMHSDMNRPHENPVMEMARALRRLLPDAHVGLADLHVCGSNYLTFDAAQVLRSLPEAEFVVEGEAERDLPGLVEQLTAGREPAGLPSVSYRGRGGGVTRAASQGASFSEVLDDLPAPAFDAIDVETFFSNLADAMRAGLVHEYTRPERILPFLTSRACPFRCSFCTNAVRGLPWRAHSVPYVVEELKRLRYRYRVERFLFFDDNINADLERFRSLARALAEERIPWDVAAGCRADRLDREIVRLAKAAGASRITVSAESGSAPVLADVVGKELDLGAIVEVARTCEEERVPLGIHYVIGMPGETKAQMNETLVLARELFERYGARPHVQHAVPYPGTRLAERCRVEGSLVAPLSEIPGHLLHRHSVIRTAEFAPGEVDRLRANALRLFEGMVHDPYLDVGVPCAAGCAQCLDRAKAGAPAAPLDRIRDFARQRHALGGRSLWLVGHDPLSRPELPEVLHEARAAGFERVALVTRAQARPPAPVVAALRSDRDHLVLDLLDLADGVAASDLAAVFAGAVRERADWWTGPWEALLPLRPPVVRVLDAIATSLLGLGALRLTLVPPAASRPETVLSELLENLQRSPAKVHVEGVPLCLLSGSRALSGAAWPWLLRQTRHLKDPLPHCRECVAFILCDGPWAEEHDRLQGTRGAVLERRLRQATPP
jgi:radical SAM superfamily enzyme YgiQ (UPF0313 family)